MEFFSILVHWLLTKLFYIGEWEHFVYVGKIAFYGWAFHFGEFKATRLFSDEISYFSSHQLLS